MQQKLITIFIAFTLVSCSTDSNTRETELSNSDESAVHSDETTNKEVIEPQDANKTLTFNVFEDYAQLSTKQEIIDAFGKENVKHGSSWYAEGTVELKHTIIRNPTNGHRIKYLWDVENPSKLSSIEASYFEYDENYEVVKRQKVATNCGLYTGMKINELRKWNGEDFDFFGFGWDYEGGISVTPKSRLSKCPVHIKLTMEHLSDMEPFEELYGDSEFSTDNELVKKAPILIDIMTYNIED